jgi:hypothetical protein
MRLMPGTCYSVAQIRPPAAVLKHVNEITGDTTTIRNIPSVVKRKRPVNLVTAARDHAGAAGAPSNTGALAA